MLRSSSRTPYIYARCLRRQSSRGDVEYNGLYSRSLSTSSPLGNEQQATSSDGILEAERQQQGQDETLGAMSRRLAEITDNIIESGGRDAKRAMEEAGFSEELKKKLEERIQQTSFRNEYPAAFAQMEMPVRHTILLP